MIVSNMRTTHPARRSGRIPEADVATHDAALVEAASRLFRTHGYAGVSIDMIAREAGVSPKTIYARHEGKLGLFKAAIAAMVAAPLDIWGALDPDGDPLEVLATAADRFLAVVLSAEIVAMERAIIAEATRLPELARIFYSQGPRRGFAQLAAYFAGQQSRGRLRFDDPNSAAEIFIALIEGELVRRALYLGEKPERKGRRAWAEKAVAVFLGVYSLRGRAR